RARALGAAAEALGARGDLSTALRTADGADAAGAPLALRAAAEQIRALVAEARDSEPEQANHSTQALDWARRAASPRLVARAFESLASAYHRQGKFDVAIALATRLLEASPADPNRGLYLCRRGLEYSELHDAVASERDLDAALRIAESARDLALVGKVHYGRGLWIFRYRRD